MSSLAIFWENTKRIMRLAKRPTRSEMWMQLKVCILGLFAVGFVAFIVQYIMFVVTNFFPSG